MITLYRLLIALLARLIMIAFGALLLYGASFYAMILFNGDARALIGEAGMNRSPLMLMAAIGTGLAIVGLVFLFFGLRGLWRRLRAGMPSEDESRAETSTGRLVSAAVFGAGALLGLLRLTLLIYAVGDQAMLAWTGVETNAVVEKKWSGDWVPPGSDRPPSAGYQIAFAFQAADGTTIRQEARISSGLYHSVEAGSTIPVTYAPREPTENRFEFARPRVVVIDAFIWIGLLSVGLWGVGRNLGLGNSDDGGGRIARADAPAPNPPASRGGAGPRGAGSPVRRQFGQRTL